MRYLSFCFTVCFIFFTTCRKDDDTVDFQTDRTIIVYMAADNDLSDNAWDNIAEMESGYKDRGTNLIVFIDSADDTPHILRIKHGGSTRVNV